MTVVERWGKQYAGTTEHINDLDLPLESESSFRELFVEYRLRAYHATRLLPHECGMIRRAGLRLLTPELVEERIQQAETEEAISSQEAACLRRENVFARGKSAHRENQVCLVLSDRSLREEPRTFGHLFALWGGEAMYKASTVVRPILARLGVPTVVTALLDLSSDPPAKCFPSLHKYFLGSYLGLQGLSADIFFRTPIQPSAIERIAQPGDLWYDQFVGLPRL